MRKSGKYIVLTTVVLLVGAYLLLQNTPLRAGDYHSGAGLICSDCHTMHYSVDGAQPPTADPGGPFDKLLLKTSTCNLCATCHDADAGGTAPDFAPDVLDTASANQPNYRAAGAFRAAVGTASVSAHNLCVAADAGTNPPGGAWVVPAGGLTCASCHDPHGTANYRNLQLRPGGFGSDITVTNGAGGVVQAALTPTSTQYAVSNLSYRADANNNPPLSNWCAGCHTNFNASAANQAGAAWTNDAQMGGDALGDQGGALQPWHRHPVTHVTLNEGNTNGHASWAWYNTGVSSRTPVASNSGVVPAADNTPFCGSCHKAHGSDTIRTSSTGYPNNLIYDDGSTAAIQDGTSMPQTCDICHKKQ